MTKSPTEKKFKASSKSVEVVERFADQCPGRTFCVTGANSGLGLETCRVLVSKGAKVILTCRNLKAGEDAVASIKQKQPDADVHLHVLDLSDLVAVKKSADDFLAKYEKLDVLINNAGVMACPKTLTKDGYENQFGVNHLGHFYFTQTLMPLLAKSGAPEKPSRVINLSSMAQFLFAPVEGIKFDDINGEKHYHAWERYGQSKLANVLFSNELNQRFKDKNVISIALHPGVITSTGLGRYLSFKSVWRMIVAASKRKGGIRMAFEQKYKSIPQGASTTLVAALDPHAKAGGYYSDCQETGGKGLHAKASDSALAKKLWEESETMINRVVNTDSK
jgi:retinol dehydrogenase-12